MDTMDIIIRENEAMLKGEKILNKQSKTDCEYLLQIAVKNKYVTSESEKSELFNVKSIDNMYPTYYIPHLKNGDRYRTISHVTPRTKIFLYNSYELEILRILAIYDNRNEEVKKMLECTKKRLDATCYGHFCPKGECFETSIIVLRFLNTAFPDEIERIEKLLNKITYHMEYNKCKSGTMIYYWLTVSELPTYLSIPVIKRNKEYLTGQLDKLNNKKHEVEKDMISKNVLQNCLKLL